MTNTTGTEPFRFTDADGDYLHIGIPTSPTTGHPAISFCTLAEPVHVPVEQIEGLITALRRLVAAQSAVSPAAVEPPADQTTPSHRAALRDHIAGALIAWTYRGKDPDPETGILETVRANAYSRADAVLAVLYREWPWLRAEAEDAAPPADRATVLREAADHAETVALRLRIKHDVGAANGAYEVMTALRRLTAECPQCGTTGACNGGPCPLRRMADEAATTQTDTLPAWLYQRFMPDGTGWDNLDEEDRQYWEHQSRAVRRAVARGGFKQPAAGARQDGSQP